MSLVRTRYEMWRPMMFEWYSMFENTYRPARAQALAKTSAELLTPPVSAGPPIIHDRAFSFIASSPASVQLDCPLAGDRISSKRFVVPSIITSRTLSYLSQSVYQQAGSVLRRLAYQHTGRP